MNLNNKNDKSQKSDNAFPIWLDASPQLSIGQVPIDVQRVNADRHILMIHKAAPN
jgi:hypothetical protein